jgi:glyoxylase-like metal-dependent hydrolase (beta-lactamase superfamily II)
VFDTFLSIDAAQDLKNAIAAVINKPVKLVVNSHAHNDHVRGNQVFLPDAVVISTQQIADSMSVWEPLLLAGEKDYAPKRRAELKAEYDVETDERKRQELVLWIGYFEAMINSNPRVTTTLPTQFFTKRQTISGSRRIVELYEYSGHTASDIVAYLPKQKILFAGDLVFSEMHPYMADGHPEHLLDALDAIAAMDVKIVVPGHGPVGNATDIETMRQYVVDAQKNAADALRDAKTVDSAGDIAMTETYNDWWFPHFYAMNMRFLMSLSLE